MRILIADDHRLFRTAFKRLLDSLLSGDYEVREAENGLEVLDLIENYVFDIIFLDVSMPKLNGYETCKRICFQEERPSVIILTQYDDLSTISHFFRLGVSFLTKNASIADIERAIKASLDGIQYIESGLKFEQKMIQLDLCRHEKSLIQGLKDGKSSKQISQDLNVTTKTVQTYRERLLKKMKVKNAVELIALVFRTGLFR